MKRILACDIDGTISIHNQPIPSEIRNVLLHYEKQGWTLLFATGRTLAWAKQAVNSLSCPYFIAPCNGASLWKKELSGGLENMYKYVIQEAAIDDVPSSIRKYGAMLYQGERVGLIPSVLEKRQQHMRMRALYQKEKLEELNKNSFFQEMDIMRIFFTQEERVEEGALIQEYFEKKGLYTAFVQDSFSEEFAILQISHKKSSKKSPIDWFRLKYNTIYTVAIGNDLNDMPLLESADRAIAVLNAPDSPLALIADCSVLGFNPEKIVQALEQNCI